MLTTTENYYSLAIILWTWFSHNEIRIFSLWIWSKLQTKQKPVSAKKDLIQLHKTYITVSKVAEEKLQFVTWIWLPLPTEWHNQCWANSDKKRSSVNKSAETVLQGRSGTGCEIIVCLACSGLYSLQILHCFTAWRISDCIPGQYSMSRALRTQASIPKWQEWICLIISDLMCFWNNHPTSSE